MNSLAKNKALKIWKELRRESDLNPVKTLLMFSRINNTSHLESMKILMEVGQSEDLEILKRFSKTQLLQNSLSYQI